MLLAANAPRDLPFSGSFAVRAWVLLDVAVRVWWLLAEDFYLASLYRGRFNAEFLRRYGSELLQKKKNWSGGGGSLQAERFRSSGVFWVCSGFY